MLACEWGGSNATDVLDTELAMHSSWTLSLVIIEICEPLLKNTLPV